MTAGLRTLLGGTALALATVAMVAAPVPLAAPRAMAQSVELPSVADLADKLLPSVVEITVESKGEGGGDGPPVQIPDIPDNSPFKDFFDEFFKYFGNKNPPVQAPAQPAQ